MSKALTVALSESGVVDSFASGPISDALSSAAAYARAEKSDATRRAYASDFRDFSLWCKSADRAALPAEAATVAGYLAILADSGLKVSTIMRRAAAIAYAHRLAGFEPPTCAESVKAVLRGIRRRLGIAATAKAPATAKLIAAMLKRIPDDMAGKRDRALLLIGFSAALRRSELVALDFGDVERVAQGVFLHIRFSKTDQEGAGQSIAVPHGRKLKPVAALDAWLAAAAIVEGPLFLAIGKGGRVSAERLSDRSVALIVKKRAQAAKMDPSLFAGHSLRAGFITTALEDDADLLAIMKVTRHREMKTLKTYDRRAEAFRDHALAKSL